MDQDADIAGESPYQQKCKESALAKSDAVHRLAAIDDGSGGVSLASLLPILDAMNGITLNDDEKFIFASDALASLVDQMKKDLAVEDLAAIGQVNFFEAFHSFASYYKAGKMGHEEETVDVNTHPFNSSIHNTPIGPIVSAKRMAQNRVDDTAEVQVDQAVNDEEEEEAVAKSSRKASRPSIICVFKGCPDKFKTTKELAAHAEECDHKFDLDLVFRCSGCLMTCPSHKAVESHIALNTVMCSNATVTVTAQRKSRERREPKTPRKCVNDVVPYGREDHSKSQVLDCPFKGCKYSNKNFENVYKHVKSIHPDQNMTFKCLACGETRLSGGAIQIHVQKCNNAKVKLKLTKKQDTTESDMLVAKPKSTNKTVRGTSVGNPVPPVLMVKKRRGRPPKSTKNDDEVPDGVASQIPDDMEMEEEVYLTSEGEMDCANNSDDEEMKTEEEKEKEMEELRMKRLEAFRREEDEEDSD